MAIVHSFHCANHLNILNMELLAKIQRELKCPKNLYNKHMSFYYRNAESILDAVKPLLDGGSIVCSDEIVDVGGRVYVKATAVLTDKEGKSISATAFARETEAKKGMDDAQITGSTSSYARKYALNGLFAIDDVKDADSLNNGQEEPTLPELRPDMPAWGKAKQFIDEGNDVKDVQKKYYISGDNLKLLLKNKA